MTRLRRLVSGAQARDLAAFVVPDPVVARLAGLDLEAAGLRLAPTPRHANVLALIGDVPAGMAAAAAVAYAQTPRPRLLLVVGGAPADGLPRVDAVAALDQAGLIAGVAELRRALAHGAFSPDAAEFDPAAVRTRTEYTCPMHPEIVQETPGSCPICGMDLVPREAVEAAPSHDHAATTLAGGDEGRQPAASPAAMYTCPMHPEIVQAGPGRCPICGMGLVPQASTDDTADAGAGAARHDAASDPEPLNGGAVYTCPMHLEAVSDQPGRCPICGMTLVPREDGGESPGSNDAPMRHDAHEQHGEAQQKGHDEHASPGDLEHAAPHGARAGHAPAAAAHADATHAGHAAPAVGSDNQPALRDGHDHSAMAHEEAPMDHGTMDHGTTDHAAMDQGSMDHAAMGHAGMDHGAMGHAGGFMSMVAMTKDLPRSADGLPMEWVDAPFGPLFPGLPGGLRLTLTLDGDTVARAALAPGATARGLDETLPGPAGSLPDRIAELDRLAPGAYALLARRALDPDADAETRRARAAALERVRAASHLGWLSSFAVLAGDRRLAGRAAALQLAAVRSASNDDLASAREALRRLRADVERNRPLRRRLEGIGPVAAARARAARGPVARAAGQADDARRDDPIYAELGFQPITREGNDALARLEVRLAEAEQSLALAIAAGGAAFVASGELLGARDSGGATVELPRGPAMLHVMGAGGAVSGAHIMTPSTALADLVPLVAEGAELSDALLAIASLDISPWELDR